MQYPLRYSEPLTIGVTKSESGSQALTVVPNGGWELPPELQNLPAFPGSIVLDWADLHTTPIRLGLYTLMICDVNRACWKLRPGYDTQWKSAAPMV